MPDLYPYQEVGAAWLAQRKGALLADEPGLGKSAQAIRAAITDAMLPHSIVVVCPASVVENWRREWLMFGDPRFVTPEGHLETCGWSFKAVSYAMAEKLLGDSRPDVLIIDEAHYLKNRKAKRTAFMLGEKGDGGLAARSKRVYALTGTPTPNNPAELWPLVRALFPQAIMRENGTPMPYSAFEARYCKMSQNYLGHSQIIGGKNLQELKERIAPHVLRRRKADVLTDLPPIRFSELPVRAAVGLDKQFPEAADVREALANHGVAGLRKLELASVTLRRVTGMAKVELVVAWVKDFLEGGDQQIVVFAQHRDVIGELSRAFVKAGIGHSEVHGATNRRAQQIDLFQNGITRVFIGQIQAAGTGITLTAASTLLFVEASWVPAENEQAAMRIHRIGQKNACDVRFATLAGSIDEDIQRALMRKTASITALFG